LLERLDEGLDPQCRRTLVSALAGFGKTTTLGEWIAHVEERRPQPHVAWVSLDEGDNDPARFLGYLVAALQRLHADVGAAALHLVHTGRTPPNEPA
jgi:LuxR family maltose regulon positive regulatory protein